MFEGWRSFSASLIYFSLIPIYTIPDSSLFMAEPSKYIRAKGNTAEMRFTRSGHCTCKPSNSSSDKWGISSRCSIFSLATGALIIDSTIISDSANVSLLRLSGSTESSIRATFSAVTLVFLGGRSLLVLDGDGIRAFFFRFPHLAAAPVLIYSIHLIFDPQKHALQNEHNE